MLRKLFLSFAVALVLLTSVFAFLAPAAHAQSTWYNQGIYEWYKKVYDEDISPPDEIFGERYTAAQVSWIIYGVVTWPLTQISPTLTACMLGLLPDVMGGGLGAGGFSECIESLLSGGITGYGIDATNLAYDRPEPIVKQIVADRPLSGITYIKEKLRKFDLIPEAHAQGFGFTSALNPFQPFWRATRNIAYSLFVVAAVVMAFMVMFRVKMSPQTIVTVQSSIPKLVIGLILVTFSYAIAGFIVDMMYVVIGILSLIFSQVASEVFQTSVSVNQVFRYLTVGPSVTASGSGTGVFGLVFGYLWWGSIGAIVTLFSSPVVNLASGLDMSSQAGFMVIAILVLVILLIVAIIMLIVTSLKIIFMLAKTFVNVILLTVIVPFQIVVGVIIPTMSFGGWVRNFVSNLAVFVVVGAFAYLAKIFLVLSFIGSGNVVGVDVSAITDWFARVILGASPGISSVGGGVAGWPPIFSGADNHLPLLYFSVSFVIFSQIPKTAEMIKTVLSGRPWAYGMAIGEAIKPAGTVGRLGAQWTSTKEQQKYATYPAGTAPAPAKFWHRVGEAARSLSGGKIR